MGNDEYLILWKSRRTCALTLEINVALLSAKLSPDISIGISLMRAGVEEMEA